MLANLLCYLKHSKTQVQIVSEFQQVMNSVSNSVPTSASWHVARVQGCVNWQLWRCSSVFFAPGKHRETPVLFWKQNLRNLLATPQSLGDSRDFYRPISNSARKEHPIDLKQSTNSDPGSQPTFCKCFFPWMMINPYFQKKKWFVNQPVTKWVVPKPRDDLSITKKTQGFLSPGFFRRTKDCSPIEACSTKQGLGNALPPVPRR